MTRRPTRKARAAASRPTRRVETLPADIYRGIIVTIRVAASVLADDAASQRKRKKVARHLVEVADCLESKP